MKKIISILLMITFIFTLTGCSFFDNFFNHETTKKKIEVAFVIGGKKEYHTYNSYDEIAFPFIDPVKGYSFEGWSLTEDGKVISNTDLVGKNNITLYPIIKTINYLITYDLDGGVNNSNNPETYTIEDEVNIISPTKTNYAFTGWYVGDSETLVTSYKIEKGTTGNITLKANYELGKYNVIFAYEGIDDQIVEYNSLCTKPTDPYKEGDTFLYWATDETLQNEFDFNTPITESITLYPRFQSINFYTLTIDNVSLVDSNFYSNVSLPKDINITIKTDYLVDGYKFVGYYINDELYTRNYILNYKMPEEDLKITPAFETLENYYTYTKSSKANLYTNISKEGDGLLLGDNIESSSYSLLSNKLFIKYDFLDKLSEGIHTFVYEERIFINVMIKQENKEVTNINIDYDINYPLATLTFDMVNGYDYSYSLDDADTFIDCVSGVTFDIGNKILEHKVEIKCDDKITTYTLEAKDYDAKNYLNQTFKFQGKTYDYYVDSFDDLFNLLSYQMLSAYPSAGGKSYMFSFFYPYGNTSSAAEAYADVIKRLTSAPYGLSYQYSTGTKTVNMEILSNGTFNSKVSNQEKVILDTTQFKESSRSDDFDDFYIEKCSVTQEVKSIYELENLDLGIKPIITDETVLSLYNKAKDICRTYIDDTFSELEKLRAIYDYIGTFVTYDYAIVDLLDASDYSSFTSYGALMNNLAVCDGIASAFKLLCTIEGIECIEVVGAARGGGHAWNKVKVGKSWFGVDATWSRSSEMLGKLYVLHTYFLVDEINLINYGDTHHYEQASINSDLSYSYFNIVNVANNHLDFYDLYFYGSYDLVCNSKLEFANMTMRFKLEGVKFIEVKLDGLTYSDVNYTTYKNGYSLYYSTANPSIVYLID